MRATTLSVTIAADPRRVYAFMHDPANIPRWAEGLGRSVVQSGDVWVAETPQGKWTVRFAADNPFGVLDHYVRAGGTGPEIMNPVRVVPNGDGSEVIFTVFQQPGVSDADFSADIEAVRRDLVLLKRVLEEGPG